MGYVPAPGGGGSGTLPPHPNGFYVPQGVAGNVLGGSITSGKALLARFRAPDATPITRLAIVLTGADTADSNVELAIYNATLTQKLATTGSISITMTAQGLKAPPFLAPFVPTPGTAYYACWAYPGFVTTPQALTYNTTPDPNMTMFGAGVPSQEGFQITSALALPLPNDLTGSTFGGNRIGFFAARTD